MPDQDKYDPNDLSGLDLTIPADNWESAGLNKAGPIGFKITSSKLEARDTKKGKQPVCALEVDVLMRREGPAQNEKFFDTMFLNPIGLRQFKKLAVACGVKPQPGQPVNLQEVVKAINGKSAFGTIVHREYTKDGEKQVVANFGKRFGKSMAEVTS